jgi:hypothetical protein
VCLLTLDPHREVALQTFEARVWPSSILRVSRAFVDWDFDGYASLLGGEDCAPFNRRVHPGAREIPDNGIDDNCILGDAKRYDVKLETLPIPKAPSPLNVVLITVESFNPDHLGVYNPAGYGPSGRATSPNLDRWAKDATVFENAYTSGGWTSVVMPSLLRGVFARRLQWRRYFETNQFAMIHKPLQPQLRPGEQAERMFPLAFGDPHPAIAEMLRRRGVYTMALLDDGYGSMLTRGTGIERGFEVFREVDDLAEGARNDAGTAMAAALMLSQVPRGQRFFLWVHFFGIHWPPESHPGIRVYGDNAIDGYDGDVAYFDSQVIGLLNVIASRYAPTAVIVAGDHGEALTPLNPQHGLTLEEAVIRIPLLIRVPGWPAVRVKAPVSSVDLVPTILSLTQSPLPAYLDGIDLTRVVINGEAPERVLFSDTWVFASNERIETDLVAAFHESGKVILDRVTGRLNRETPLGRSVPWKQKPRRSDDVLTRALYGYIEETGGALELSD